jgi:hypothetical protein
MTSKQILLAGAAAVGVSLAAPGLARADEGGRPQIRILSGAPISSIV